MYASEMLMGGNLMQKRVYDGENARISAMGNTQELMGEDLERFRFESKMHKFLRYAELDITTELVSVENINGKKAYKVKVTNPSKEVKYDYYDAESGLKVRSKSTVNTPNGEITQVEDYKNYRDVRGVKFPFKIEISGAQTMVLEVTSIAINTEIEESVFKL
jgi:hypothetical protein